MTAIDRIMELSGPFTTAKARESHRRWLEGLTTDKLEARLLALLESQQRNPPAKYGYEKFALATN